MIISVNSNLPFEAFIEVLRDDSNIETIYDIFDIGRPNINHFLIAKLAKAKYVTTIFTTNFDQLIEKAFNEEGLVQDEDYKVFYKDDELDPIIWDEDKIHIIKLHGSINDKNNMAITLQNISVKNIFEKRMKAIEYIFSKGAHKNVLVLGYSCSDIFDITPTIEAIREKNKNIFYIDHSDNYQSVKDISCKMEKNPFKQFVGSKWILYKTDDLVCIFR